MDEIIDSFCAGNFMDIENLRDLLCRSPCRISMKVEGSTVYGGPYMKLGDLRSNFELLLLRTSIRKKYSRVENIKSQGLIGDRHFYWPANRGKRPHRSNMEIDDLRTS